jgi:ABC-type branched-subunit amino acid transport system permease subunit
MRRDHVPLLVAVLALAVLPFALDVAGLPLRTAIDVVVFAIACMGLNILVGHTGLVSFGHGAWFGLGAYAAALSQRYWFPATRSLPRCLRLLFRVRLLFGRAHLRARRLFLAAHAGADRAPVRDRYRWTEFTGGESGLGGVDRRACSARPRSDRLLRAWPRGSAWPLLPALALSPLAVGTCWSHPRERAARALRRLSDQPLQVIAFVLSAGVAIAGTLRCSITASLAEAADGRVLGRARRHGGDRRNAKLPRSRARRLFFILFREFLSIWTPHWLFWFGLLFVGFIVFSPDRPGRSRRGADRAVRRRVVEAAAMAGRTVAASCGIAAGLSPLGRQARRRSWSG